MTPEIFSKAVTLNSTIHKLKELLDYLNKYKYANCVFEKIGELLYDLYQYGDEEIKNSIKTTLEDLLDKAETKFKSL